jgi:hypothetical protein
MAAMYRQTVMALIPARRAIAPPRCPRLSAPAAPAGQVSAGPPAPRGAGSGARLSHSPRRPEAAEACSSKQMAMQQNKYGKTIIANRPPAQRILAIQLLAIPLMNPATQGDASEFLPLEARDCRAADRLDPAIASVQADAPLVKSSGSVLPGALRRRPRSGRTPMAGIVPGPRNPRLRRGHRAGS